MSKQPITGEEKTPCCKCVLETKSCAACCVPLLFLCPSQKNNKGRGHQFEFYYCQLYGSITLVPQLPLGALILLAASKLGGDVAGSGFRADHGWTFISGSGFRADATLRHAGHHRASIGVISFRAGDVFLSAVYGRATPRAAEGPQ